MDPDRPRNVQQAKRTSPDKKTDREARPGLSNHADVIRQRPQFHLAYLLLALVGVLLLQDLWQTYTEVEAIPYSRFEALVSEGQIEELTIQGDRIMGTLKKPTSDGKTRFVTNRVDGELAQLLEGHDIVYQSRPQSSFLPTLLSWIVPIALFFGVWLFLMRRMSQSLGGPGGPGGLLSIGKSQAKVYLETDTATTFDDVAGVDEAKAELQEVVQFLKDPEGYGRLGARMPKGILLVGPPGTGKTLLARAVAGQAGVPFFSISGSEFVEMFVGVGAARVRDLFEQAQQKAPCIIFIDELDALGRARSSMPGGFGGHDEKEQTLNQLLVELDGFDGRAGIVLLAATNRPEILDPALLRAGRFDRQVLLDAPDRIGRKAILEVHLKKIERAKDLDPEKVAALTPGFTGADLANLVNEAALAATRRSGTEVGMDDFTTAIERIVAGLERRSRLMNPRERDIVAHHEMGHALVAAALPGGDPVHKVSIIPRGIGALGYTLQRPSDDRHLMTREELEGKLGVLQGGRAAEKLVYEHTSTGAADDLARATDIARDMVTRYAMVPSLGAVSYDERQRSFLGNMDVGGARRYSEETAREIDLAVREIVDAAFERALGVLRANRDLLESGAAELLEHETLDERALATIFEKLKRPDDGAEAG